MDQSKKTMRHFYCRDVLWETFEQMANDFDCSIDYLINEAMRYYARSKNLRRTKMWTLVQEENYRRMGEHVALAQDLGFRHLVFSLNLHGWGDPALEARNRKVTVDARLDLASNTLTILNPRER